MIAFSDELSSGIYQPMNCNDHHSIPRPCFCDRAILKDHNLHIINEFYETYMKGFTFERLTNCGKY